MVIISPEELKSISNDARRRILEYVLAKGVKPRDLGVSSTLINMIKKGKREVSDQLLIILCRFLSPDEFRVLTGQADYIVIRRGQKLNEVEKSMLASIICSDEELRAFIRGVLKEYEEKDIEEAHTYYITIKHLERFEKALRGRSSKTRKDHLRYLRKTLSELNWKISPTILKEYVEKVKEERGPHVACHVSKALKLFIKKVINDPILYSSFRVVRPPEPLFAEAPTIDEVKRVAKAIEWPPAKAYFILLAETGLRPGELFKAKISWLKLEARMLIPCEDLSMLRETKRAYITFFSEETRKYLKEVYLPYRKLWLEEHINSIRNLIKEKTEEVESKLFPFRLSHIRREIYNAMDKVLGKRFKLQSLRIFFSTYMTSKKVPPLYVNIWQGRIPPKEFKLLQQRYLGIWLDDLKRAYDETELCILCE